MSEQAEYNLNREEQIEMSRIDADYQTQWDELETKHRLEKDKLYNDWVMQREALTARSKERNAAPRQHEDGGRTE